MLVFCATLQQLVFIVLLATTSVEATASLALLDVPHVGLLPIALPVQLDTITHLMHVLDVVVIAPHVIVLHHASHVWWDII